MLDLSNANITACAVHRVGSRYLNEDIELSRQLTPIENPRVQSALKKYFLNSFSGDEKYNFTHSSEVEMNEAYTYCSRILQNPHSLLIESVNLAKHLYNQSEHPQIKSGEFYVVQISDCYLDGRLYEVLGLFKSEQKNPFLKVDNSEGNFYFTVDDGIDIGKLDKGCLVFHTKTGEEDLFVLVSDSGKSADTQYWREYFLGVEPVKDNFMFTNMVLKMTKDFVTREMPEAFSVDKPATIEYLNKSLDYFKENDVFDKQSFAESVFEDSTAASAFIHYQQQYEASYDVPTPDSFEIHDKAVKKQAKIFKSVLKLDKNFHVYIHGNRELIEKGIEPDGRKYYKLYYKDEE